MSAIVEPSKLLNQPLLNRVVKLGCPVNQLAIVFAGLVKRR